MSKQVRLYELLIRKPADDDESCKAKQCVVEVRRLVASGKKCRKATNRTHSSADIKYGFTYIEDTDVLLPQCVMCAGILSDDTMKPAKLKIIFQTVLVSDHETCGFWIHFYRMKITTYWTIF